jgi:predicted Zn-dependent protease
MINKIKNSIYAVICIALFISISGCDKNNNLLLFSVNNDIELGKQVQAQIAADAAQFPILSESQYPESYAYLKAMTDAILNSGEVAYKEEFAWEVKIIQNDEVLNAFATPGGYIYVYTGLIKFLDQADDLAGVMGHEIAHADLRHSSRSLQKQNGVSFLLKIALGDNASGLEEIAGQVAGTVAGLSFSREFEAESDARSVEYLASTNYACNGAFSFFQKLIDSGSAGGTPEFLSTHPDPSSRVADINTKATEIGCDTTPIGGTGYTDFQNSLP